MQHRFHTIEAEGVKLTVDTAVGHIRLFEYQHGGSTYQPLHVAPWVDDPQIASDPSILPNLKFLAGDFFCAPFGKSDVESAPSHGWPANSEWVSLSDIRFEGGTTARFELKKRVMGATILKEITLLDRHPFAYQRHIFRGGEGAISVASHAMTQFDGEGQLSFSTKVFAELPGTQQEESSEFGRSLFAKDVRFEDLTRLPLADGTTVDLHHYPIAERHEDFVMLVEAKDSQLGWFAATRAATRDIVLSLKSAADFPVTFLWYSNGGRFYKPWNSRHLSVLGIEEGRANSVYGHASSIAPNPLSEMGVPTSFVLGPNGIVDVRHIIGGSPLPNGWKAVASVEESDGYLVIEDISGKKQLVPYDKSFLAKSNEYK